MYTTNVLVFEICQKSFYGIQQRWMFLSAFVRPSVWKAYYRAWKDDVPGNFEGEGRLLGGLFVIDSGDGGILLEHKEKEFGDTAKLEDVMAAARKISTVNSKL